MIERFIASWELFHWSYLAGWLIAVLLSITGVLVVARDQIFLGAAVSQASTLGVAIALWVGASLETETHHFTETSLFPSALAVSFSVIAALVTARGGRPGRESREAITGWVFLFSASLAILLVSHSPHEVEELHKLLFSSIIVAAGEDVLLFGALAGLTLLFTARYQRRLLLFATDPAMASAAGMRVGIWSVATLAWLGLAVGLSIRASGPLYTFGCLVLPALAAKNLSREVRPMLYLSPLIALGGAVLGSVLAHEYDYPPAQVTVALLSVMLALAWGVRLLRGPG
jgi:zinc transport system permease protein